MKIFKNSRKINFVDENDVFVGFDFNENQTENLFWFLSDKINGEPDIISDNNIVTFDGWRIDVSFFQKLQIADDFILVFRILKNKKEKFLHIKNVKSPYCHGFSFSISGQILNL